MKAESTLLKSIWLKAHEEGAISVTYATHGEAVRMRLNLYNAAKSVRDDPFTDPLFHKAVRNCEIVIEKLDGGGGILRVRRLSENPLFQEAARQLNLDIATKDAVPLDEDDLIRRIMDSPNE